MTLPRCRSGVVGGARSRRSARWVRSRRTARGSLESGRHGACALGRHGCEHLDHVGVDYLLAGRNGCGHPVMAVDYEVQGRPGGTPRSAGSAHRGAAPAPGAPSGTAPAGGGPEAAVEIVPRVDRADDRVQPYRLQAQVAFAALAQCAEDLVERQDAVDVTGLAAQAVRASLARTWRRLARRNPFSASARGNPVSASIAPPGLNISASSPGTLYQPVPSTVGTSSWSGAPLTGVIRPTTPSLSWSDCCMPSHAGSWSSGASSAGPGRRTQAGRSCR